MDTSQIRRARLRQLLREECGGKQVVMTERTDISASQLSQLLKNKGMGAKIARKLEAAFTKPHGWMDSMDWMTREEIKRYSDRNEPGSAAAYAAKETRISYRDHPGIAALQADFGAIQDPRVQSLIVRIAYYGARGYVDGEIADQLRGLLDAMVKKNRARRIGGSRARR